MEESKACEGCRGECGKESNRYFQPRLNEAGRLELVPCGKGAKLPYGTRLDKEYERTRANDVAIRIGRWYIKERPQKSLYIFGGTGTGKTFLASLIARHFDDVIFLDVVSLLGEIKRTFNGQGSSSELIKKYSECGMLVLDDLGAGYSTEWSANVLYQIINNRYVHGRRLIITSNYDLTELETRLKVKDDDYTATRIISRLHEMSVVSYLGERDRRCPS